MKYNMGDIVWVTNLEDMEKINNHLFIPLCSAKTDKSGSAKVIINPIINPQININFSFFELASPLPILEPIGIIDALAPMLNSAIPITSNTEENENETNISRLTGVTVTVSNVTIKKIGIIEKNASFNLTTNSFILALLF